ncbi:unnamed protein product, partial [Protopolystoma xenopodis]
MLPTWRLRGEARVSAARARLEADSSAASGRVSGHRGRRGYQRSARTSLSVVLATPGRQSAESAGGLCSSPCSETSSSRSGLLVFQQGRHFLASGPADRQRPLASTTRLDDAAGFAGLDGHRLLSPRPGLDGRPPPPIGRLDDPQALTTSTRCPSAPKPSSRPTSSASAAFPPSAKPPSHFASCH